MIVKSYPKINLYLKIIGLSKDSKTSGFSLLESKFFLVENGICDFIEIKESNNDLIKGDFNCKLESNTIFKALNALRKIRDFPKLSIEVEKHIPFGAGLGGGSSNAGVLINTLDSMFDLNLSEKEKTSVSLKVGADVAFFAYGFKSAFVSGIGEVIKTCLDSTNLNFEIFTPSLHCDTKVVYDEFKKCNTFSKSGVFDNLNDIELLDKHKSELNDLFLPATRIYKELDSISENLGESWKFSGSGSSFFRKI